MKNKIAEILVSYKCAIPKQERVKISSSKDIAKTLLGLWDNDLLELQEQFWLVLLNRANEIIGATCLYTGGSSSSIVEAKLIFSIALKCNANSIIISHNHPSGNIKPSNSDIEITKKVLSASKFLGVEFLDHIILTKDSYFSFADERLVIF